MHASTIFIQIKQLPSNFSFADVLSLHCCWTKKKPLPALYQSSSVKFTQLNVTSLVTTCKSDSPHLLLFEHVSCYTCRIAMNPKDLTCKFHMDSYEPSTLSFSTLPIFSAMEYNVALALSDISRL